MNRMKKDTEDLYKYGIGRYIKLTNKELEDKFKNVFIRTVAAALYATYRRGLSFGLKNKKNELIYNYWLGYVAGTMLTIFGGIIILWLLN